MRVQLHKKNSGLKPYVEETKSKAKREREMPAGHPAPGHPEKTKNHGIWRQDKIEKPDKNVSAGKDAFQTNAELKGNVHQRSHAVSWGTGCNYLGL